MMNIEYLQSTDTAQKLLISLSVLLTIIRIDDIF